MVRGSYSLLWLVVVTVLFVSLAHAKNCGVIGAVYPIQEPDLLHIIQQKMLALQTSGELAKKEQAFIQQAMDRPQPVANIQRTQQSSSRLFDPSVTLSYDMTNNQGKVLLPAGSKVNPLTTHKLSYALLFYNADDSDQVRWAETEDQQLKGDDKLILVGGSVVSQEKLFKKPIYFDQQGLLTTRLNITHVPAIVTQQGLQLWVQEVTP